MLTIFEKKTLAKTLHKLPNYVVKHYEIWKRIIEFDGLAGLKLVKGFHDEPLKGEWDGFRSSRLTKQWRVIYTIEHEQCEVYVIDINAHNYRRR